MVPPGSDGDLMPGGQMTELTHLAAAETLRPAVGDPVVAVQTEETVVTAGAAVVAAAVQTASVVSRGVLEAGRQPQVLLVSQTALAPSLGCQSQPPPGHRLAAVLALRQDRHKLAVDQRGKRHAGVRVPQPGRGRGCSRGSGGRLKQQALVRGLLAGIINSDFLSEQ